MDTNGYGKTSMNGVIRYRNRGKYDYETIHSIVDKTPILHVSYSPKSNNSSADDSEIDEFPVILPMMGFTGDFENRDCDAASPRWLYLHGYVSARMMRTAGAHDGDEGTGMPICVAATLFDGVVLALTPNHHSCNYRSAVVFGRAHVVTDDKERLWAMERITDNLVPGRWANTRCPNATERKSTGILRVEIVSASAKIRTGSTGEDRKDLADHEMRRRVWAGAVPTYLVWGEPVPAETNMTDGLPGYLDEWRTRETAEAKEYACSVAK
ncbi:hypothetical protein ARSEF1564_007255 [Beauveria bassiana]